jgi:phenylalanyl-tRNA synthetase alpha chain
MRNGETLTKPDIDALKKRRMAAVKTVKTWTVAKGPKFALERKQLARDVTAEMLKSGDWATESFKEYNFDSSLGVPPPVGACHPLMKVRKEFRNILLEMGFEEMPTNNFVESSFWNFDTLFQPQQHPARDSHDTFFVKCPAETLVIPEAYKERVRKTHETGEYGGDSIGYRYDWDIKEARKNILRTHTTAVSSRMLYKLAQGPFEPKKYFSIDRVFRNETLDYTHLAEFHQVEGFIADRNLTLGDLIGTVEQFFHRIGIKQVRFKPAFNPYTEPSMEVFGFSEQLGKWIELGNSGIFRPEMLQPMGLPEDVRVIAWGLSLERPTMIKYGIKNIRSLFGPKVNLDIIRQNPIARFDE